MIFVTGATGTVGSQVVRALLDKSARVRAGVHTQLLGIDGIESCAIDYNRFQTLLAGLEDVRTVFLVLAMIWDEHAMLAAARNVIDAARSAGVEHVVKLSAYGAGDGGYPHARWHRSVEREFEHSGMAWTFLRANAFMQTLLKSWTESIRKEGAFYDAVEGASYAPIDARDIARVAARALTESGHEGKAYELTGPEALSWEEAAETISRVLDRPIRYVRISDEDLRQSLLAMGLSEEMAAAWVEVHQYTRRVPCTVTSSVQDITGRAPVSFAEFCRDYVHDLMAKERETKSQNNVEELAP